VNAHVALSASKRQLLEKMMRGGAERSDRPAPIAPRPKGAPIPLSADQRQVWLHAIMAPDVPLYNESITIHRFGAFDADAMGRAVNEILRRHEAWRTAFVEEEGELVQRVREHRDIHLPFDDVSHLPEEERDAAALKIGSDDARRAIDLSDAPLFRARIVRLAEDNHRLYFTLHHIIFDGVSIYRVIVPELAELYEAFARGELSPLPAPTLQYGDYAVWQKAHLESPAIRRQVDYWRQALADAPRKLEILGDRPRPARPTHAGSMETFHIPLELTEKLKATSRQGGVTLYMTLLAAYHALLHRYSGEEDIVVGGVTDLRRRPELERVVGYFLNTIALRAKPRGDLPFRDFVVEVRDSVLGALAASEAPFDEVVRSLGIRGEPGAHPLFNCLFSIEPPVDPFADGWDLTQMDVVVGGAKFDLYLELDERPDGMIGRFLYSTELFDPETIRRMIGHWLNILDRVAEEPGCTVRDLPLLGEEEKQRLLVEWNDTARPSEALVIPDVPDSVAIRFGGERVTYSQLHRRSAAIAAALRSAGLGKGDLVGICLDRSPDMVAALLAVHRIGAAYLPLDPDFPPARLDYIVKDAGAAALLTEERLTSRIAGLKRILLEDISADFEDAPAAAVGPNDLAYVIYTSGSTGNPKGVEISHGALANLLASMRERPGFGSDDSLLAVTTLSFDIAGLELFLPLLCGGELVIAPRSAATDPRALAELIAEAKPTVMQATPATWRGLIEAGWEGDKKLRILCGGEAFPRELAEALLVRAGEVWNMYGPTETTIWSTVEQVDHDDGPVPIGRPIANTQVHILDRYGNTAPVGVVGELFIGGAGVARGYRNRPDLTAERFVEAPAVPGARLYRTGDLARYRPDGTILCLGRVDNDEKIRGYRVAVEEIEGALAAHPDIAAAAVRSWPDASGERGLAAYCVGKLPDRAALRAYLAETLPDYMIPAHFVALDALPMTPNRKIDRKALPPPTAGAPAAIEPPQGGTEERLAAIWCELLRAPLVGRDDNFFELGGHSLLVARLLVRIEREWGRRIGMAEFFQAPTLRKLASRIESGAASDLGELVPLQPEGRGVPLLWIDGGPGFLPLAQALGTDRPFLGLPLGPILQREMRPGMAFEDIAAAVIPILRASRPKGPYLLGGWCTNGILAFEIARQLRAAGEEVPLLVLGHSSNPVAFLRIGGVRMKLSKLGFHFRAWRKVPWGERLAYIAERLRSAPVEDEEDNPYRANTTGLETAAYGYRPGKYEGAVAIFQPADRPRVLDTLPGWSEVVTGPIQSHDIPGTHGSMVEQPNVAVFAQHLREALARV